MMPTSGRERPITRQQRLQQADVLLTLSGLVERNRLALVVFAAHLALVGNRARGVAAGSAPARWLAKNAVALRLFLLSLTQAQRCAPRAGYRAIQASRRPFRRRRAPRLLCHRLQQRTVSRVDSRPAVPGSPRFLAALG